MKASRHPVLSRGASGLRHLRWTREVLGTLAALASSEEHLPDAWLAALRAEVPRVTALVDALSAAVKPYRDFLERTRTRARGAVRAARFLFEGGAGVTVVSSTMAELAIAEMSMQVVEREREALRAALEMAIDETRAGLEAMDARLGASVPAELVAALYPPLTADATRVLDDGDPDDDAAGSGP